MISNVQKYEFKAASVAQRTWVDAARWPSDAVL